MQEGAALQVEAGRQGWGGGRQPDWVINSLLSGQGKSTEYLHISLRYSKVTAGGGGAITDNDSG